MFSPVSLYRFSNKLWRLGIPILPKATSYLIRLVYGCWLPYSLKSGKGLVVGYGGLGVVIHGESVIGENVHIDQGVTIGGNGILKGTPRIGNNVTLGAGSKVLGPIVIGDNVIVGANAVVVKDVPENSVVAGVPAKIIRNILDDK